jgi:hypothetical protein
MFRYPGSIVIIQDMYDPCLMADSLDGISVLYLLDLSFWVHLQIWSLYRSLYPCIRTYLLKPGLL